MLKGMLKKTILLNQITFILYCGHLSRKTKGQINPYCL